MFFGIIYGNINAILAESGDIFLKFYLKKLQNLLRKPIAGYIAGFFAIFAAFFTIELVVLSISGTGSSRGLIFGFFWSALFAGIILSLPRLAGRIVFGVLYFPLLLWALAQTGYYLTLGNFMWLSTTTLAKEGSTFFADVLKKFPAIWWIGAVAMIGLGALMIWLFPPAPRKFLKRLSYLACSVLCIIGLIALPSLIFRRDNANSLTSNRAIYNNMYDAKAVYDITGFYQLLARDIWVNEVYPQTPAYNATISKQENAIDAFFNKRGAKTSNPMTGAFAGKNVILVMMESMDDWMITPEDTPTLVQLMQEGVNFTNFYTPGYGSARTLNSEFCMNTGIYLPTTSNQVFDYLANSFDQSLAAQLGNLGYDSRAFHYNKASYYSRNILEPAMGYSEYVSYMDYTTDKEELCNEQYFIDQDTISDIFFREGPTLNTILTRAAHLGYTYREITGYYALKKYPEYKSMYNSEEEICARVKAKIVDDMFARLLDELEARGQLENTVIIGMTDHYTYGYKNLEELYSHSGVSSDLLLEKTPCFIWSADGPSAQVDKTLNTADFLPTMLNLLGVDSPYHYLGQDAFDPNYRGYAIFPDGSWICDGVAWQEGKILMNKKNRDVTQTEISEMQTLSQEFLAISNQLLSTDYYKNALE